MISFYLGGARSGKSRHALSQAKAGVFIATAEVVDSEFEARIFEHKKERGEQWHTIECPLAIVAEIERLTDQSPVIVVDCLTVWLGNLMHYEWDAAQQTEQLIQVLSASKSNIYLVSNEVGQGVVPEHAMGRQFRDLQGRLNQRVASIADRVELLVAGIPLVLK